MNYFKYLFLLISAFALSACGDSKPEEKDFQATEVSSQVLHYAKFSKPETSTIPTKILLVAGSNANANFAQEIVEQKKMWMAKGYRAEEIECFYSIPFDNQFQEDEAQYRALATDLAECSYANPGLVYDRLSAAGKANSGSVYLYVSSHGAHPESNQAALLEFPFLDQFRIALDVLPDSKTASTLDILRYYDSTHEAPERLFFTPRYLKNVLKKDFTSTAKKFMVFQACFSGGFIDADNEVHKQDTLIDIENTSVLTAAHYSRTSFGCSSGETRTNFGGAFNDELKNRIDLIENIDWKSLYSGVKTRVEQTETKENITPSLPMYWSNLH